MFSVPSRAERGLIFTLEKGDTFEASAPRSGSSVNGDAEEAVFRQCADR
jgi:hypothetical protein